MHHLFVVRIASTIRSCISRLKRTKIIPIYKDNDVFEQRTTDQFHYFRILVKYLEKLMYKRLKIFFEKNLVLYFENDGCVIISYFKKIKQHIRILRTFF